MREKLEGRAGSSVQTPISMQMKLGGRDVGAEGEPCEIGPRFRTTPSAMQAINTKKIQVHSSGLPSSTIGGPLIPNKRPRISTIKIQRASNPLYFLKMSKFSVALNLILAAAYLFPPGSAASHTLPPAGSVIVRAGTTTSGKFQTVFGGVDSPE